MSFGSPLALLACSPSPAVLAVLRARLAAPARRRRSRSRTSRCSRRSRAASGRRAGASSRPRCSSLRSRRRGRRGRPPAARLPVRVDNATIVLLVDVSGLDERARRRADAARRGGRGDARLRPAPAEGVQGRARPVQRLRSRCSPRPTADHERIAQTLDLLDAGLRAPRSATGLLTAVALVRRLARARRRRAAPGRTCRRRSSCSRTGSRRQGRSSRSRRRGRARAAGIPVDTVALGTAHGILGYGPVRAEGRARPAADARDREGDGRHDRDGAATTGSSRRFYRRVGSSFGTPTRTRDIAVVVRRRGGAAARSAPSRSAVACGRPLYLALRGRSASSAWPPNSAQPAGVPSCSASRMRRVGAELEQRLDRLAPPGLRGEVERRHALAVVGPAERAALVRVGAELDELPDRRDAAVHGRPDRAACRGRGRPRRARRARRAAASTSTRSLFAAQTSASSSTSCGSSEGCQAGKPPCGR